MEICSNLPVNEQTIDDISDDLWAIPTKEDDSWKEPVNDGWTEEAVDELEEKIYNGEE